MFRQDLQVSNGKRYVVIECQFGREWGMVRETRETVSEGEALEIVQYCSFYSDINADLMRNGQCFSTREDAQKWLDFMKSMME